MPVTPSVMVWEDSTSGVVVEDWQETVARAPMPRISARMAFM